MKQVSTNTQKDEIQPQQIGESREPISREIAVKWLPSAIPSNIHKVKNHSSTYYNGLIYLFGGYDGSKNHDSLYSLNIETFDLTLLKTTGIHPKRRNGHSATLVGNDPI